MNETTGWFTTGRTVLIMKDRENENVPNFRSMTGLVPYE